MTLVVTVVLAGFASLIVTLMRGLPSSSLTSPVTKIENFNEQMASHVDNNPGTYWQEVEIFKDGKPSQIAGKILNLFCSMFSVKAKTVDLKRQELKTKEIDQDSFDALVQGEEDKRAQWEKNLQEIKPKIDAILD